MWYDSRILGVDIMAEKAFDKKLPHSCEYCVHGERSVYAKEILCKKRGVTEYRDSCRKYKYNPLKRDPIKTKIGDNYSPEDFKL